MLKQKMTAIISIGLLTCSLFACGSLPANDSSSEISSTSLSNMSSLKASDEKTVPVSSDWVGSYHASMPWATDYPGKNTYYLEISQVEKKRLPLYF